MVDSIIRQQKDRLEAASDEARAKLREWDMPDALHVRCAAFSTVNARRLPCGLLCQMPCSAQAALVMAATCPPLASLAVHHLTVRRITERSIRGHADFVNSGCLPYKCRVPSALQGPGYRQGAWRTPCIQIALCLDVWSSMAMSSTQHKLVVRSAAVTCRRWSLAARPPCQML